MPSTETRVEPGPVDRASFFDEQARHRRSSRIRSALCGLGAVVLGAPLAVLLTPLVVLALIGLATVLPTPEALVEGLRAYATSFDRAISSGDPRAIAWSVASMLAPGMLAMLALWLAFARLFAAAGAAGAELALGAREPHPDDLEELQLVNVVAEMAIAAGIDPPAVKLVDIAAPNAAVASSSTVLVTRGVLDALDRAETQAIAGHLVGSIGNGDPRLARSVFAVYESLGLLLTILDAAFGLSPSAVRELAATLCFLAGPRSDPRAALAVAGMLGRARGEPREDGLASFMSDAQSEAPRTRWGRAVKKAPFLWGALVPLLLLYVVSLLLRWQVYLLRAVVVEPFVLVVWRSRRHLADAVAVQLTRQPDALRSAIDRLGPASAAASWTDPLFLVGGDERGRLLSAHPSLTSRRRRLVAMGATPIAETEDAPPRRVPLKVGLVALVVLVPLGLVMGSLMIYVIAMSFLLAFAPAVLLTALALLAVASFLP